MQALQLREETQGWKRYLDFIKSENVLLKSRLSDCLQQASSDLFLARAEIYQNQFVISDEMLVQLGESIAALEGFQISELLRQEPVQHQVLQRQRRLRKEMEEFTHYYFKLKMEFNAYMTEQFPRASVN
jgi:hypothetical protein